MQVKKFLGSMFTCALSIVMLSGLQVPSAALGMDSDAPVMRWGQVRGIDEDGTYHLVDGLGKFAANLSCVDVVDAQTGAALESADIKDGDVVKVWFDGDNTSAAVEEPVVKPYVAVTNFKDSNVYSGPDYYETSARAFENTSLHAYDIPVVSGGEEKSVRTSNSTTLVSYRTQTPVKIYDIGRGSRILAWKDEHASVTKVVVLPYAYRTVISWNVDTAECWVNGGETSRKAEIVMSKDERGEAVKIAYLPVEPIAKKLGFLIYQDDEMGLIIEDSEKDPAVHLHAYPSGEMHFENMGERVDAVESEFMTTEDGVYVRSDILCDWFAMFYVEMRG